MNMRIRMTALEFRRFLDGFGLALMLLGCLAGSILLLFAAMDVFGVRYSATLPSAFEGLVLTALGGGLRLLVRIDKRLEANTSGTASNVS